ncbi:MAG TPA: hypothetical protein VFU41_06550 [Gemmatimonadales bacterium]|nr:hypothetical protein [Gemmatimonadales bacterium]
MSDQPAGTPAGGNLQFERAERAGAAPGLTCGLCQQPIAASYYEVNGNVTCQRCRNRVMAEWNRGSPGARFAKALGLGFAAAAVGAGLYFAIAALTGYEFGLVAIVVGLLVGGAVRKGSNGRGGWRYQALALFLTYTAVVVTDSSMIARELSEEISARADSLQAGDTTLATLATAGVSAGLTAPADGALGRGSEPGTAGLLVGLALLTVLAYAAPIMIGIASPIHLLIAGFALYEAWKLNKGAELRVTGPYRAVSGAAPA